MGKKNKRNFGGNQKPKSFDQFDNQDQDASNIPFSKNQQLKLMPFTPRTAAQKEAYAIVKDNTLTFLGGAVGTGKSILLCRVALEYLEKGLVKKIIITRPAIESGPKLGYLPGTADQKMLPYLIPVLDNFEVFIGAQKLKKLMEERVIECVPIGICRGRTFNNAFLIVDEGQNLTTSELYMVLTRMGQDTFGGMTYDADQIDIKRETSCVLDIEDLLGYDDIGDYAFGPEDIMRSEIVRTIIWARDEAKRVREGGEPKTYED